MQRMFFMNNETRERHRFIDQSIENAHSALNNSAVVQRLGDYAAQLAAVEARLYVANIRHDRVVVPAKYRDTDRVPVVTADPGRALTLGKGFGAFNVRQRQQALATVRTWRLHGVTPDKFTADIEASARQIHSLRGGVRSGFEATDLASVDYCGTDTIITGVDWENSSEEVRCFVRARPLLRLKYVPGRPLSSQAMLHEYEHIDQYEREPIVFAADEAEEDQLTNSCELEAYHVGSLCMLGLRDAGELIDDGGLSQIRIDEIRMQINGPQSFRFNDQIGARLAAEDLDFRD